MKRNTKIFISSIIVMMGLIITYSCVEPVDLITDGAKEGGGIVTLGGSSGKVLGVPDGETGVISFTDNELSMKVDLRSGGDLAEAYTVVKQFNGGVEIVVEEFSSVPHTVTLTTLDQFLSGTGKAPTDLRIGDTFVFRVKANLKDGRVVYSAPSNGAYTVTVNCSSNLAGTYTVTGFYTRTGSGIVNQPVGPRDEVVTEISPGNYTTELTGERTAAGWGVSECPMFFSDVCGELIIESQYLCDAFANQVAGTGTVDSSTGNIHFEYTIAFPDLASDPNPREYVFDYVKQ